MTIKEVIQGLTPARFPGEAKRHSFDERTLQEHRDRGIHFQLDLTRAHVHICDRVRKRVPETLYGWSPTAGRVGEASWPKPKYGMNCVQSLGISYLNATFLRIGPQYSARAGFAMLSP